MGLSKKQQENAERLKAALDAADKQQNMADALELAKAVEDDDEKKADEIAARLKGRGAY